MQIDALEHSLTSDYISLLGFCHNDLQYGNMLLHTTAHRSLSFNSLRSHSIERAVRGGSPPPRGGSCGDPPRRLVGVPILPPLRLAPGCGRGATLGSHFHMAEHSLWVYMQKKVQAGGGLQKCSISCFTICMADAKTADVAVQDVPEEPGAHARGAEGLCARRAGAAHLRRRAGG